MAVLFVVVEADGAVVLFAVAAVVVVVVVVQVVHDVGVRPTQFEI